MRLKPEVELEDNLTPLLVVAVALERDGRFLLQQRSFTSVHGGLWEFPGGKVEPGETPEAAAVRELEEELGLVLDAPALKVVSFASGWTAGPSPRSLVILFYRTSVWSGEPQLRDAAAIGWYAPGDIAALAMPPLDYPLAAALLRDIGESGRE